MAQTRCTEGHYRLLWPQFLPPCPARIICPYKQRCLFDVLYSVVLGINI